MSDIRTRLESTLRELHAELEGASTADPEVRRLLGEALGEIQAKLGVADASAAPLAEAETPSEGESLPDRLRDAALHFEGSHPTISTLINSALETLSRLGI